MNPPPLLLMLPALDLPPALLPLPPDRRDLHRADDVRPADNARGPPRAIALRLSCPCHPAVAWVGRIAEEADDLLHAAGWPRGVSQPVNEMDGRS